MRPLPDSTRERSGYKGRIKYRIEYAKHRMMKHPIAHRRFMNMAHLGVTNIEAAIRTMFISTSKEFMSQAKDIFFNTRFKFCNINLASLVFFERIPRGKKILRRDYVLKYIIINPHMI
jgi:hypothetical protein